MNIPVRKSGNSQGYVPIIIETKGGVHIEESML